MPLLGMEETRALLAQARGGDAAAYEGLFSAFAEALCGALLTRWPKHERPEAEVAAALARRIWDGLKAQILRKPEDGGYAGKAAFHRWVVDQWMISGGFGPEDDLRSKLDGDWPVNEEGDLIALADVKQRTPEELIEECAKLAVLLEVVFLPETGYPHQQLSFVLGKYIFGIPSKRGYDCNSALVVREHSRETLGRLAEFIADQCSDPDLDFPGSPFSRERVCWLKALEKQLRLTLAEVMAGDGASLTLFKLIKARVAGLTRLEDYWPGGAMAPEDTVTAWCHKVGTKLRHMLGPAQLKGKVWEEAEKRACLGGE